MKISGIICAVVIMATAAEFAYAQKSAVVAPQSPVAGAGDQKERTASETRAMLERLACGPSGVHVVHHTLKGPQSLPEQPEDKGLIYVIRTKNPVGGALKARLAMDGKWVGINGLANYFYIEADPGAHYFCLGVWGEQPGLLSLVIEKGKTYYLRQTLTMGGADLDVLDEAKGKQYVAKYRRTTFEVKRKK
jgi:hypothetical protein